MKKVIFSSLFFFVFLSSSFAQDWLDKATKTVRDAKELAKEARAGIKTIGDLKKEIDKTAEEFNKDGRVEKGNSTKSRNSKTTFAKIKAGKFKDITWLPIVYEEDQVFPSAIVTLSTYNKNFTNQLEVLARPVGFVINSQASNKIIKWEIESSDKRFFDKVSGEFIVDEKDKSIHIMPEIPWNYQKLTENKTSTPASITYRFFDDKGNKVEETKRITYRSINDCILFYKNTQTHYMFAGYVQESHPEVDVILKEALQTGFVNSFSGYQSKSVDDLVNQTLAIWRALQLRKMKYSSITTSSANDTDNIFTQSVRTFDNSINNIQANCVDGTVVFASILRKIGIHTQIITVKGHCYLGIHTNDEELPRLFIETTALGSFPEPASQSIDDLQVYKDEFFKLLVNSVKNHYARIDKNELIAEIDVEEARQYINAIPVY